MKYFKRVLIISLTLMNYEILFSGSEVKITSSVRNFVQKHIKSIAKQIVVNFSENEEEEDSKIIVTLENLQQALTSEQAEIFEDFVTTINQQYIIGAAQAEVDVEQPKNIASNKLKTIFANIKQNIQEAINQAEKQRKSRDKQVKEKALRELGAMTFAKMFLGEKFIESSFKDNGVIGDRLILLNYYIPYMNVKILSKNQALLKKLKGNLSLDDSFDLALQAYPEEMSDVERSAIQLHLSNAEKETVIENVKWFLVASNNMLESRLKDLPNKVAKIQNIVEVLREVKQILYNSRQAAGIRNGSRDGIKPSPELPELIDEEDSAR
ncbi:hypothetical protein KBB68_04095 [Candidatus Babeliales bacterium]|nr:hypothetical protein [Candidatus Babeliales bacterium]